MSGGYEIQIDTASKLAAAQGEIARLRREADHARAMQARREEIRGRRVRISNLVMIVSAFAAGFFGGITW